MRSLASESIAALYVEETVRSEQKLDAPMCEQCRNLEMANAKTSPPLGRVVFLAAAGCVLRSLWYPELVCLGR